MVKTQHFVATDSSLLITIVHMPAGCASFTCNEPFALGHPAYPRLSNPVDTSTGPEVIALGVSILTPKLTNGRFPYREHVTASMSLRA